MKSIFFAFFTTLFFIGGANAQITYEAAFPNIGFVYPVELQASVDDSDRFFVVEQPGRIKVFPNNTEVNPTEVDVFLNITDRVLYSNGQEIGLLGLAFHPDYDNNGYFYVYYTTDSPVAGISVRMVLSRFSVSPENPDLADPNSELVIFQFDKNQNNSNHNGGKIDFGPDGYLYISFGDGGGGNDPQQNAQNIENVFGSICRIDVDVDGSNPIESNPLLPNGNYEIPSDNPFVGVAGLDEIFAYGLRNTWKFSFDVPSGTIWGADVGQNAFEEINLIQNGNNYGWSRFEANSVANGNVTIDGEVEFPIHFYDRSQGDISITGGFIYRGTDMANLVSKYIFGDYVSGRVWSLEYNPADGSSESNLLFQTNGQFISTFGIDKNNEIYFCDYGNNAQIYRITDGETNQEAIVVDGFGQWLGLEGGDINNGEVFAVKSNSNGDVYHGGNFSQAGAVNANNIAVWNESTGWNSLGSGTNGIVNTIEIDSNGNVYIGGNFSQVDGIDANNIALWDGSSWNALATGTNGPVLAMEIDINDNLYVAGIFETIGNMTSRNIASWNGNEWSALMDTSTSQIGTNNEIRSLHIADDGILYVGGNFDEAGGNTANRIATWNGSNWSTLGDGTSGFVQAITSTSSDVYLGGNFALAGEQTVNRIVGWNMASSDWFTFGNGVNNNVNSLLHDGTHLYAAGQFDIVFDIVNDKIVNNIARWSPINGWEALGRNTDVGVDIKVNDMSFANDDMDSEKIFAVGNFSRAGTLNTDNSAIWLSENYVGEEPEEPEEDTFIYYPNPTTDI
ncbi:MAG: PQQ-dependent sugar dehydrogenase, partial [Bacteroidia bacterium]|nr:PQQ-dependent sugar dehydrogenase [Bacteroidia bacterium]